VCLCSWCSGTFLLFIYCQSVCRHISIICIIHMHTRFYVNCWYILKLCTVIIVCVNYIGHYCVSTAIHDCIPPYPIPGRLTVYFFPFRSRILRFISGPVAGEHFIPHCLLSTRGRGSIHMHTVVTVLIVALVSDDCTKRMLLRLYDYSCFTILMCVFFVCGVLYACCWWSHISMG
jgi:hypothetical protein